MPDSPLTPQFDAFKKSSARQVMTTSLGTAELRQLGPAVLARSVFTARGTNAIFVSKIKEVVDQISAGDLDEASARLALLQTLQTLNYTPEGGFPEDPAGLVPPAIAGSLQDLSSFRRLDLIIQTQRALMEGAGQQYRGSQPDRLRVAPAWELIRIYDVETPRDWPARWAIAGGKLISGRMVALKGHPIWGELGAAENFPDALNVDHPPFAFFSGMGWQEISAYETEQLDIRGPEGQTAAEYHGGPIRPLTLAGPVPQISTKQMDPPLRDQFLQATDSVLLNDGVTATPADRAAELRVKRAEIEQRMADRLAKVIADRKAEYARR